MFNKEQKRLLLNILLDERKKLFSKYKGKLLDKTISDLLQMLRNEENNNISGYDNALDWSTREKRS